MRSLAACFSTQLGMTNGCLPASLLLHEVLTQRGVACRLRQGYLVLPLPGDSGALGAAAHMWVEAPAPGGSEGAVVLDIGGVMSEAAGLPPGSYRLAASVPPGAARLDLTDAELGAGASLAEAAMAAFAAESDARELREAAEVYWEGAPQPLQAFRRDMLRRFAP